MTSVDAAIIGACMAVAGSITVTLAVLRTTRQREERSAALETVERIASLEGRIWSCSEDDGPALLSAIRALEVRLRAAGVPATVRATFGSVVYTCWIKADQCVQANEPVSIPQTLLNLRNELEEHVISEVLDEKTRLQRRRVRNHLLSSLSNHDLVAPPTTSLSPAAL